MATYKPKPTDTVDSLRRVINYLDTKQQRLRVDLSAEMLRREIAEKQLKAERTLLTQHKEFAKNELNEYKKFAEKKELCAKNELNEHKKFFESKELFAENELKTERDQRAEYEESMDKVVSGYQFYAKVSPIRRESSGASSASKVSQRQKDARQKDQQVLQTMLVTQEEEPTKVVLDQVRERQRDSASATFTHDVEDMKMAMASATGAKKNESHNQNQARRLGNNTNNNASASASKSSSFDGNLNNNNNNKSRTVSTGIDSKRTITVPKENQSQSHNKGRRVDNSNGSVNMSARAALAAQPSIPATIDDDSQLPVRSLDFQSHTTSPTKHRRAPERREVSIPPTVAATLVDDDDDDYESDQYFPPERETEKEVPTGVRQSSKIDPAVMAFVNENNKRYASLAGVRQSSGIDPAVMAFVNKSKKRAAHLPIVVHEIPDTIVNDTIPPTALYETQTQAAGVAGLNDEVPPTLNDEVPPTLNESSGPPRRYVPVSRLYDNDPVPATIDSEGYDSSSPIKTRTPSSPGQGLLRRPSMAARTARASASNNNQTIRKREQTRRSSDPDIDIGTLELRARRADGSDDNKQSIATGQVYTLASRSDSVLSELDARFQSQAAVNRGSKRRAVAVSIGSGASASANRGSKRRDVAVTNSGVASTPASGSRKREKSVPVGNMIGGQAFVCTGLAPGAKSTLKKEVVKNGGLWRDSVNSRTKYLVAGKVLENGKSAKRSANYKKATEQRVQIIDEAYFQQMVLAAERNDITQMSP